MTLSPMRYKNYTWPHNPRVYSIDYEKKIAVHKTPFGLFCLQDLGRTNRVMEGSGEFVGENAYEEFKKLATIFYDGGPGLLVHPLWQPANAYFVSLKLGQEPRPDYVCYSFAFWEDDSGYTGLARRETDQAGGTAEVQGQDSAGAGEAGAVTHLVVKGDTLWAISRAYGTTVQAIAALNPQIKNPNLIRVGDRVRVK